MSDLIERNKAIDAIWDGTNYDIYTSEVKEILEGLPSAQPEITDVQAIEHLQETGWMQNHDHEIYESGLRDGLGDDSGSYDALIPKERITEDNVKKWCHERNLALITNDLYLDMRKRWSETVRPEQKVGKWILYEKSKGFPDWHCSVCNGSGRGDYRICPWCGAKMEG